MCRSGFLVALMFNITLVASAQNAFGQSLAGDWVQTGPPFTNRIVLQADGTGTIVYGLGNYEQFRWTANQDATITFRNRSQWSNFTFVRRLPNRTVSFRITNRGILQLFGRKYQKR